MRKVNYENIPRYINFYAIHTWLFNDDWLNDDRRLVRGNMKFYGIENQWCRRGFEKKKAKEEDTYWKYMPPV